VNGNQVCRKIPMFASWGHKFKISCTTCKVIITTAGPNQGGGGRGSETVRTKFLKLVSVAYQDMDPEKYSLSCRIKICFSDNGSESRCKN
jgi:hypothetical protein